MNARNQTPLLVPVTAIYSPIDAIVAWQACIDSTSANVEHVEVRTTHLGFVFSPEVYEIIAGWLALDGMKKKQAVNQESSEGTCDQRARS